MHAHAKRMEFELADSAKKKIFALTHINDVALIRDDLKDDTWNMHDAFRIEAYDVAHLSGKNTVGVMTVVTNGAADKASYRKFKIRGTRGNDDYENLREILRRRFGHDDWGTPQLVVIDGGIGQYNAASQVLREIGRQVDLVSVIKDDRHKPKAFHGPEDVIKKYKKDILLANSEAHRFAIAYHRQKRSKEFLG